MGILSTDKAEGLSTSIENVIFSPSISVLERKALIIASYDETNKTSVVENTVYKYNSDSEVGSDSGFGFMAHRLAKAFHRQAPNLPIDVIYQPEGATPAKSDGLLLFSFEVRSPVLTTTPRAGIIHLYVNNDHVPINVSKGLSLSEVGDLVEEAIGVAGATNISELPITAVNTAGSVATTAKSSGPWGDKIKLSINLNYGEEMPDGLVCTITPMSGGVSVPDIQDALDALGTGDNQNLNWYTAIGHGYLLDSDTLTALSEYNGLGNEEIGNYDGLVARPFNAYTGDTDEDDDPPIGVFPTALATIGLNNKNDRTNVIATCPGSVNHPSEIAMQFMAANEKSAGIRPEETIEGTILSGVRIGSGNQWNSHYSQRSLAVKSGISTTKRENGSVVIGDIITLYHPDNVPFNNNGYRDIVSNNKTQNILNSKKLWFGSSDWKGITLVDDASKVTNAISKEKIKDLTMITGSVIQLVHEWEGYAWIYSASFTVEKIIANPTQYISFREDGLGFNIIIPVIYSANGKIRSIKTQFDVSLSVFI